MLPTNEGKEGQNLASTVLEESKQASSDSLKDDTLKKSLSEGNFILFRVPNRLLTRPNL